MLQRITQHFADMTVIKDLCVGAERHALDDEQEAPGAEHFLLAALDLSDGAARRVFGRVNADPAEVRPAIVRQHVEALRSVGLSPDATGPVMAEERPLSSRYGLYHAAASGEAVMQALARREDRSRTPLSGAHVVAVIAGMRQGVAARALRAMRVNVDALRAAAEAEIVASQRQSEASPPNR